MALQFVQVTKKDQGRGIDAFSAKGAIPDGYVERLENVDTNANGKLSTRTGYEGYYGWLPLRVTEVQHVGTKVRFKLDAANTIDFSTTVRGPLVAYGKLSEAQSGDWSDSDSAAYYASYAITSSDVLGAPSGTLTKTAAETGATSANLWVGIALSTSTETRDNEDLFPDDVRIDLTTYEVELDYTVVADETAFFYYAQQDAEATVTYLEDVSPGTGTFTADAGTDVCTSAAHTLVDGEAVELTTTGTLPAGLSLATRYYVRDATASTFKLAATEGGAAVDITDAGTGTHTWTQRSYAITAATHQLQNFQLLVRAFDTTSSSGDFTQVVPELVSVDTAGQVLVEFANDFTGRLAVRSAPLANIASGVAATGSNTFTISSPGAAFNIVQGYRYNAALSRFEQVIVDAQAYDADADEITVDYTLASAVGEPVEFYWVNADIIANVIEVDDTTGTSTTYVDDRPQVTLWGVDHDGIYKRSSLRGGHVSHLDGYRTVGDTRLVAGLGGNLFEADSFEEVGTDYLLGDAFVDLQERAEGDQYVGPLFVTSASNRTRGDIVDASVSSDNYAVVTTATWVSAGVVDYTLEFTSKVGTLAFGTQVDGNDQLTVRNMARAANNGTFTITAVTDSINTVTIRVSNPGAYAAGQVDETGAAGGAGVFTDTVEVETTAGFLPGDALVSAPFTDETVLTTDDTTVYLTGVTGELEVPDGLALYASRTTQVLPLRTPQGDPDVTNFVRGDMLRVGSLARRTRVLYVNVNDRFTASSFSGDGTTGTVTCPSAHYFATGQRVALQGVVDGEVVVTAVPSSVTFEFATTETTGTLDVLGPSLHIDESLAVQDGTAATAVTVDGRWVPVEAPTDSYDLTPSTYVRYLDESAYDSQNPLKSTTVADSMYFTNQQDEVWKFDGTSLYRAGFPRWQLGLFAQRAPSASALLSDGFAVSYASRDTSGNSFRMDSAAFSPGARVYESTADAVFVVTQVNPIDVSGDTKYDIVVRPQDDISGTAAAGTLKQVLTYKYYHRLNAIDANDNVVASAFVGSNDQVLDSTGDGQLRLRLVGLAPFGAYDYDRIEVETYRTGANGALYYLVNRQVVPFNQADGYIDVNDAQSDSLIEATENLDPLSVAVLGGELGTTWDQPPRAKGVTSLNNRLVLYNLRSYPQASLVFRAAAGSAFVEAADVAGSRFLVRKDSTDTGTTTDMVNRVGYEFVNSGEVTITPSTDIAVTAGVDFTITSTTHGLSAGDWVYLFHAAAGTDNELRFAGWWQIASTPSANEFTINYAGAATATTADVDTYVTATAPEDVPVWIGTDGNLNQRDGQPTGSDVKLQAAYRLASAVNASQRLCDVGVSGFEDFEPWLAAGGGNDLQPGEVVLESPVAAAATPEVVMPSSLTAYQVFANDLKRAASAEVGFRVRRFPSRIARSYRNFPEIFDAPFAASADVSDSVIDINPADGQEITTAIPFFGESTTGENQQLSQELVVFKPNSVYVVNVETGFVQRVDSRGLGCTAPRSVGYTHDGVVFANESGVYVLTRSMEVRHLGLKVSNVWRDEVNADQLAEAVGHHYGRGRRYKLAVPAVDSTYADQVLVYDYERAEFQQPGAWTLYTNHQPVWWCNLERDAYWASQAGDVFLVRQRGEAADFRDEDQAIDAVLTLRAEDFDLPSVRKVIGRVTGLLEPELTDLTNVAIEAAMNLTTDYQAAGDASVTRDETRQLTVKASIPQRRGTHVQLRFRHSVKDEQLVLAGVAYKVGQASDALVKETADT